MTDPATLLVKLRWQHGRLLTTVSALEAFVATQQPGPHQTLVELRWALVRDMLLHFGHMEKLVLQPLMGDRRERAAQLAARSSHDLTNTYRQFERHAQNWYGPVPACSWCSYREAVGLLMRRIRVRLMAEESEIFPLLPFEPGEGRIAPTVAPIDYGAEVLKVRSLVYADRGEDMRRLAS